MKIYSGFKRFFSTKSKTFIALIFSYSLVLIVPIITTFFICAHYQSALNKQQIKQNTKTLDSIGANVSDAIKEIQELYTRTMSNENLEHLLSLSDPMEYRKDSNVNAFLSPIYSYYSNYVDSVFIYIQNSDTVLAKNAICDSSIYYKACFESSNRSYNDWIHSVSSTSRVTYDSYYNESTRKMELLYKMPYTGSHGKKLVLCAVINNDMLFQPIESMDELFYSDIYLSDANGNILSSYLNLDKQTDPSNLSSALSSYGRRFRFHTKSIYIGTSYADITVVSLKSIYSPMIRQTLGFSLLLTLICLLLCCFMIIYFCTKHYAPISEFMRLLNIENSQNDYAHIRESIEKILSKNTQLSHQTNTFKVRQRKLILSKYISGNYSPAFVESALKAGHIEFKYHNIAIIVFKSTDLNNLYFNTADLLEETGYNELLFITDNIFTELYSIDGYTCDIVDSNGYIFCVISSSESVERINAVIEETMEYGVNVILENFGIHLQYTVSALDHTADELSIAASEAMYLMNYKNMVGDENPLFYSSYKNKFTSAELFFSPEIEHTLINYISNGQEEKTISYINEIFDELKLSNISPEHLRCVLIDIALVLFKVPNYDMEKDEQDKMFGYIFSSSGTLDDMKAFMLSSVSEICSKMSRGNVVYKDKRLEQITAFIDKNYTNPAFSMKFIANEFHLDGSYLTKQFKSRTDMSIIDYVNKLRIEKAKELISDVRYTNTSMETIAGLVGYSSVRTFNRIFTKKEGITPAAYKKS